jgi:hypothetical protein
VTFGTSLRKLTLLLVLVLTFPTTTLLAGSFFAGGGVFRRFIAGDGSIAWTATLSQGPNMETIIDKDFVAFDVTNSMAFTPELGVAAGGGNGLGWDSPRNGAFRTFIGYRFYRSLALTVSLQLPFARETIHREAGVEGAILFNSDLISRFRQSAIALEARVYPKGESFFLSLGIERTTASLQFAALELIPEFNSGTVFEFPANGSSPSVNPIIGVGYEHYFLDFFGLVAQASYSFADFKNYSATTEQSAYPWVKFDNGGLGIFLSTTFRPTLKR